MRDILALPMRPLHNDDTADMFDFHMYDYIVDAIDTVTSKRF